jgi:hypothetical protein
MAFEMKPGQGSAFRNEKKEQEWHADFKGKLMLLDGSTVWLDVTKKKKADGEVYVAVKIREMKGDAHEKPARREPGYMPPLNDDPDGVPF